MSPVFYISYVVLWVLLLIEGVLLLLVYRHFGLMALDTSEGVQRDGLKVGETAPPVSGVTATGERITWQPRSEGPQLVLFASPDCRPCAEIFPFVGSLATAQDGFSLPVIGVAMGEQEVAIKLEEKFKPPFPFLVEERGEGFHQYRVRVTPFAFVIGADGRILAKGLCTDVKRLKLLLLAAGLARPAESLESAEESVQRAPAASLG